MPSSPRPVVLLGDTRGLHHHGCEAVVAEILHGLSQAGMSPSSVLPGFDWQSQRDTCLNASLVVINGEGSLHHSRPLIPRLIELAEQRRTLGRPTALINTSWFSNSAELTSRLDAFALVCARDAQSAKDIASHAKEPLMVPDQAILHALRHRVSPSLDSDARPMVGDSTIPDLTRALRQLAGQRNWQYLPVLARPTIAYPGKKSRKIRRHYQWSRRLGPLARWLLSPRHHAHLVGAAKTEEYLDRLAAARGVLTGRFHTVCMAIGLRTPFIAVGSNTPKIEALLRDAGLDPATRMCRPDQLSTLQSIPPFTATERASLDEFSRRLREDSSMLYAKLSALI